jgi:uncharacterized membrane protein YfcA
VGGAMVALALPADTLRDLFALFIGALGLTMLLRPVPREQPEEGAP